MLKYKIMFNQLIKPREFPSFNSEAIQLLFCDNTISLQPHLGTIIMHHFFCIQKKIK